MASFFRFQKHAKDCASFSSDFMNDWWPIASSLPFLLLVYNLDDFFKIKIILLIYIYKYYFLCTEFALSLHCSCHFVRRNTIIIRRYPIGN